MKKVLLTILIELTLVGCSASSPQATPVSTSSRLSEAASSTATTQPSTLTPVTPTTIPTRTTSTPPVFSLTLQAAPTLAATPIFTIVTGKSISPFFISPDSRWLPYIDFDNETLHFYDTTRNSICDFPSSIHYLGPDHFMAWLPDGRVVIQAANDVESGLPCSGFVTATPAEILTLDHQDPSFSPGARYQAVEKLSPNTQGPPNQITSIIEVATGKIVMEANYVKMAQGGGTITGYWLDGSHFLIPFTVDQGPLLLAPGKPVIKVASDIFHLPLTPGSAGYDIWMARSDVESQTAEGFHLMLIPVFATNNMKASNPLQIYNSETGQVETLPYLVTQGAFSNDGHWLMVSTVTPQGEEILIRPIDPPGSAFQPLSVQELTFTWSPDGSKYYQVSQDQATITVYSFSGSTLLGSWQAPDYELSPSWSPDGKFLVVWSRKHSDYNQQAIFVIPIKGL